MPQATVCLTVDFDAVSPWIHGDPAENTPVNRSRGVFGAEVGAPRLLELFDSHDIDTTWFVPGHTIESFPEPCEDVWAAGHAVQHHGWSHRPPGDYESREAEREDLKQGIATIEELTDRAPTGYRSPAWDFSEHTVELLVELGFDWDSSAMARDVEPYYLRSDRAPPDGPYEQTLTDVVEVPVSWQRDDFPPLAFVGDRGFVDEVAVFRSWREQFDWTCERGGVFVLTMHPQVMGMGHRLERLEELIEHAVSYEDVAFRTVEAVAQAFE